MKSRSLRLLPTALIAVIFIATPVMAANDGAIDQEGLIGRSSAGEELEKQGFQAASAGDVVITGGGWGHGIGMPQWGAQAMALAGHTHETILTHFYTGAQFGQIAPQGQIVQYADPVHVGVAQNQTSVTFIPRNGSAQVCLGTSCHTANANETWSLQGVSGLCRLTRNGTTMAESPECGGTVTWSGHPITKVEFSSLSRTYARGSVGFTHVSSGLFHVSVRVPMQEYLYGLAEVPNSWHSEALKAQAVAARTFALYRIWAVRNHPGGLRSDCACQLVATTADQAYRGWYTSSAGDMTEGGPNGANWKQAVDQTVDKAMWHTFQGAARALEAYYFSSTGASTENNEDRWGGGAYPYLRSRSDPGARAWSPASKSFSYQEFAQKLGFSMVTWVEILDRYDSGRPVTIEVQGVVNGTPQVKTYTSSQFLNIFGLQSQWIWSIQGFIPPGADRVVLHNPTTGQWSYRAADGTVTSIYYGTPGDRAISGDWDCDGVDTPGLYRQGNGFVYLRNSNTQGIADISFFFGVTGDIPVAGDFDGDGCDTVSIYRPSEARFHIINHLGTASADYSFFYGVKGDVPFMGDWNGDGIDTPGLRRPNNGFVYLRNNNSTGFADGEFFYGVAGDVVFSGDWDANGADSIGLYRPSNGTIYLRNALSTGVADITYQMGGTQHKAVAAGY